MLNAALPLLVSKSVVFSITIAAFGCKVNVALAVQTICPPSSIVNLSIELGIVTFALIITSIPLGITISPSQDAALAFMYVTNSLPVISLSLPVTVWSMTH